jgi:DNA invertase Pin-like site-specific DNA recombinase
MTENFANKPKIRCAVYTRKSREEGLDQSFNSLDAQRLAAENYIASQISEGWVLLPDYYDDGAYSGGNTDRPAFQRLLKDIKDKKVDCVVVYKADRISRSLFDFTNILNLFDEHKVSFTSVTESFNTATASGRLMLGMIMSFAQYERELASERVRDKIGASKKKGMWMGGNPPLGYDIDDKKLIINEKEAKIITALFNKFIETESVTETARDLNLSGFTTKIRISGKGRLQKGGKFTKKNVRSMLENPVYAGKIQHKDQVYDGLHKAIIDEQTWQEVRDIFSGRSTKNQQENPSPRISIPLKRITTAPLLKGIIKCGNCGRYMIPTYTTKRGKRYRYYLCSSKAVGNNESCLVGRISAGEAENLVTSQVLILLKKPEFVVHTISQSINRIPQSIVINSLKQIEKVWEELFPLEQARIIHLLIKDIVVRPDGLNIRIFKKGLTSLTTELND